MPKGQFTPLAPEQEDVIKAEYLTTPVKTLAKKLGVSSGVIYRRLKRWNLTIPPEIVEQRKRDSLFKKGDVPGNKGMHQSEYMTAESIEQCRKTQFKKGNEPHNTKYNGHERTTKDGYIQIRLSKGLYRLKHIVEWEKINGKLPKNHCLTCLDGDKTNTSPDNWTLTSRVELMYRNSKQKFPREIIPSLVLVNKINKQINTLEDGKE